MIYIGIDPGTSCGWAVNHNGNWTSGVWDLKPRRHEGGGMRYVRMANYLSRLWAAYPGEKFRLFYEEVRGHKGTDAAHIYGGIIAMIGDFCETKEIPYMGIPVGTIKKAATGKGNSGKPAMIAAGEAKWPGHIFESDDEADARWIVFTGMIEIGADE